MWMTKVLSSTSYTLWHFQNAIMPRIGLNTHKLTPLIPLHIFHLGRITIQYISVTSDTDNSRNQRWPTKWQSLMKIIIKILIKHTKSQEFLLFINSIYAKCLQRGHRAH